MKKNILGVLVAAALVAMPIAASAQSLDVQSQINALLAQIKVLQAQLVQLIQQQRVVPPPTPLPPVPSKDRICKLISRSLAIGSRGDDVSALQAFLKGEGYYNDEETGFFGSITSSALAKWQASQGLEGVGNLGPLSRARILKWCGTGAEGEWKLRASPHSGEPPLTVTFGANVTLTNNNMIADAGDYKIVFGDGTEHIFTCNDTVTATCKGPHTVQHTYAAGSYKAELIQFGYYGAPNPDGSINTHRSMGSVTINATGPVACTMEYAPVCGSKPIVCITTPCNPIQQTYSNKCAMNADGATYLYSGECKAEPAVCTKEYRPVCGQPPEPACRKTPPYCMIATPGPTTYSNKCTMEAAGATFLYEGQCKDVTSPNPADDPKCKAWYDGCNNCSRESASSPAMCTLRACIWQAPAYCTAYFDNTSTNKPPVVSGISGPTTLTVGTTGTWTVNASDPENGQLSYQISWGDEYAASYALNASSLAPASAFQQTSTFTHSYAAAGVYTIKVTVRDNAGQEAKTSTTVQIGSSSTVCTMEYAPVCGVFAPNVGVCVDGTNFGYCSGDKKTFSNRCMLDADTLGFEFLHTGECGNIPAITNGELSMGWYWGQADQKKSGTPSTWIHTGGNSRGEMWYDPGRWPVGPVF